MLIVITKANQSEDKRKEKKNYEKMKIITIKAKKIIKGKGGMEMVQVAILVAIAIVIGLIFRTQIEDFVDGIFANLSSGRFQ